LPPQRQDETDPLALILTLHSRNRTPCAADLNTARLSLRLPRVRRSAELPTPSGHGYPSATLPTQSRLIALSPSSTAPTP